MMTMSPTGQVALVMSGSTRRRVTDTGKTDFDRWFGSSLARDWSRPRYIAQLTSLIAGDFLVADPGEPFDPALPPEVKALSTSPAPLKRTAASVPEETLRAIQACFAEPPVRYRLPAYEIVANYQKAEALCAKAIAAHSAAPDLWIVRNRRIIAQLGLWKISGGPTHYQRALEESKTALGSGAPPGAEVAPRYCLATESLRHPQADPRKIIAEFVEALGGENAPGPALAAASLLALHVGNRGLHEEYRNRILEHHADHPAMWAFVSFLLNREHRYWLFRVPFVAGWSYGRQHQWLLSRGGPNEIRRPIRAELQTLEGKPYRLPEDAKGKWTIVLFTNTWLDQERPSLPGTVSRYLTHAEKRGANDVQVIVAVLDGEPAPLRAHLEEKPLNCPTLVVPGGTKNPLVQQLGILDEDQHPNALLLRPDGTTAAAISGLTMSRGQRPTHPQPHRPARRTNRQRPLREWRNRKSQSPHLQTSPPLRPRSPRRERPPPQKTDPPRPPPPCPRQSLHGPRKLARSPVRRRRSRKIPNPKRRLDEPPPGRPRRGRETLGDDPNEAGRGGAIGGAIF